MSDPDRVRLRHMLDAATEALAFVTNREKGDLLADRRLTLALMKEIEIVGEAASRISTSMKERHPDIPWSAIVGMRNRLIHAYADIDLEVVWSTVTSDLPRLVKMVKALLESNP
jgi:uncharacterized protein with HEPN domain